MVMRIDGRRESVNWAQALKAVLANQRQKRTYSLEIAGNERVRMNLQAWAKGLRASAMLGALLLTAGTFAGIKNMAVVVSAGSKLNDVSLADLTKLSKGVQKTWPDGKNFTLVIRDPESPDMRVATQKLFGVSPGDVKALLAKLNEARPTVKIVENDEDLLRTVEATPGAVGIVDVYSINSSVKVLRVDGKLPFDLGYALKGN
jgi:ABC-type phosphate transport system substrate-binding protein